MTINNKLQEVKALFNDAPVSVVKITDLERIEETQQRLKKNTEGLEIYTEAMKEGEVLNFPPIRVVRLVESVQLPDGVEVEKGALILADGFTRIEAAELCGIDSFKAEIVDGSLDDAVHFSFVANSLHGQKLDQKDYQALIRKLYTRDPNLRKGDLARAIGCSAQTVSKAVSLVEEGFKGKALQMFDGGFSDKEIAKEVHKVEQTIKNWRKAWEEAKETEEEEPIKVINPMKMKFEDVLALENLEQQNNMLVMLQIRVSARRRELNLDDPEDSTEPLETNTDNDVPFDVEEVGENKEPESPVEEVVTSECTCWAKLGRSKEQVIALANPKASLKRSMRTQITSGNLSEEQAEAVFQEALRDLEIS